MDFPRIWSHLKFFCIENIIAKQAIPRGKNKKFLKGSSIYVVIREKEVDIIYLVLPKSSS